MGYILIGASTGGPKFIERICKELPKCYKHTLCIVQHMGEEFTASFVKNLNELSKVDVLEAYSDMKLTCSKVIVAKGGLHLHFKSKFENFYIQLVENKTKMFVPSVDEMFFSALDILPSQKTMAVLLTGIGDDGAMGMVELKKRGFYTLAQNEQSSPVFGMPKVAYEKGGVDKMLDFDDILREIINYDP